MGSLDETALGIAVIALVFAFLGLILPTASDLDYSEIQGIPDISGFGTYGNLTGVPADLGLLYKAFFVPRDMVLWYPYKEGTGTLVNDYAGFNNYGTITSVNWNSGFLFGGLTFDGTGYVTSTVTTGLDFTTESFSVSFWINNTLTATNQQLTTNGRFNYYGWRVFWYNTNRIYFETNQASVNQRSYSNVLTPGDLMFVTIVRTGTNADIYVNGTEVTAVTASHTDPVTSPLPFRVGADACSLGEKYSGSMFDLRIFNRALNSYEILVLYDLGV